MKMSTKLKELSNRIGWRAFSVVAGFIFAGAQVASAQQTSPPPGVCSVSHQYFSSNPCVNDWSFSKVELAGWSHNSTCNTSTPYRYWNTLGSVVTLNPGSQYTVSMTTLSTIYNMGKGAWIDYNQDGNFSTNEYIGTGGNAVGQASAQFTVPCNAKPGQTLVRFRCDYYYVMTSSYGCGSSSYGYGETMDFIVTIAATGTPSANFAIPDTVYQNSPALFVNNNQLGYISHSWDVLNYGISPDATSVNYTGTFANTGTYQLKLTSTNCQGSATTTKSFDVVAPTSSPKANYVVSNNSQVYDGTTPIYVDYFDLTLYGPTSWEWVMSPDWLNGAPFIWLTNNFDQNPSAFFYDVETYDVCLIVGNSNGYDTLCRYSYIEITAPSSGATFNNILGQNNGSTLDSGYIFDSGGASDPYSDYEYYTFIINPCGANSVTLIFDNWTLSSGDNLKIYEGSDNSGTLLGTFNNNNIPDTVKSHMGSMYLVWTSDAKGTDAGFKAGWTSHIVNNGPPAADFVLPDTVYACSGGNNVEFVNSSTGVLPGQASYDWIFDYDPNLTYPTGYADIKDEENPTWNYTQNGTYNVRAVLKSCEGNDTVVKTFILANTSNLPIMSFTSSERIIKVNQTSTLTAWGIANCSQYWAITPNTYKFQNGADSSDREVVVKFTAPGSYSVRLYGINDNGTSYAEKTNIIDVIDYCHPTIQYSTVADVGMVNVQLGDISNKTTSGVSPGYTDYTGDQGTTFILGQTYSYSIERPTKVNNVNLKVWIDYNRDGEFTGANELVVDEVNSGASTFTGTITVPGIDDVIVGESRMRIGMGLANTSLNPCGPSQVGEYEDYTIILDKDIFPPIITMIGGDTLIEINKSYMDPGAKAFDNIEGDISSRIMVDNSVDTSQTGVYFVKYDVSDLSGLPSAQVVRKVQVVADLTKPDLTLNGANPLMWSVLVPFVDPGFSTVDLPSGASVDSLVIVSGMVSVDKIGDYTLTYNVMDAYGNSTTEMRTVQVRDTTAPEIISPDSVHVQIGEIFSDPVMASDNFDMGVMPVKISGFVIPTAMGAYTQTYSVEDASGNRGANKTVVFIVGDFIPPVIDWTPGTQTIVVDVFNNNWENAPGMQVTAHDNYYKGASLVKKYSANFDINAIGTYTVTYEATDKAMNMSTFVRTVMVKDREKPIVVANSLNLPRWSAYDLTQGVAVVDNYYAPVDFASASNGCSVEIVRENVDFNYPGIYQVTYVAIDGSGNRSDETVRIVQIGEESANTSVDPISLASSVNVYPNPNAGQFTIEITSALQMDANIQIVNSVGSVVRVLNKSDFSNGKADMNLSDVAAGVYYVRISNAGQTATKKVVITK